MLRFGAGANATTPTALRNQIVEEFSRALRVLTAPDAVDEALAKGVEDGLGAVVDVQLLVDVGDVVTDGPLGDP